MGCMNVRSAEDMAMLLHSASRDSAADFARAEHEKACAGWDQGREMFWRRVVALLGDPAALTRTQPAPRRPHTPQPAGRPVRRRLLPKGVVRLARG